MPSPLESNAYAGFETLFAGMKVPVLHPVMSRSPVLLASILDANPVLALIPESYVHAILAHGRLALIPTEVSLPLAPLGILLPTFPIPAAQRFADYLVAHGKRGA